MFSEIVQLITQSPVLAPEPELTFLHMELDAGLAVKSHVVFDWSENVVLPPEAPKFKMEVLAVKYSSSVEELVV